MKGTLTTTLILLGVLAPLLLFDGRRYRVLLAAIILLLPFYQTFIYLRHMAFVLALVVVWLGDDRQMLRYLKEPINRSMMVFFVAGLVSTLLTASMSAPTVVALVDLMFFYIFFLLCLVAFRNHLTSARLPGLLLIGLLVSIFIQTMQALGYEAFYLFDEAQLNNNTGMSYEAEDRLVRYWGPFGNSLTFSSYLAVVGVFLFVYYHNSLRQRTRVLSALVLLAACYGIMLTAGRTALVSVLIGLTFYAFLKNWKAAFVSTVALVVILLIGWGYMEQQLINSNVGMFTRFMSLGDDKGYRAEIWVRALPVFISNPLFGTGPGNLTPAIAPLIHKIFVIEKESMSFPWGHVENTYLSVLYTFGLVGFSCFVYMLVKSFAYGLRARLTINCQPIRQLGLGLATGWVVIGINMISNPIFVTDYRIIALMLLFVALSIAVGWHERITKSVKRAEVIEQDYTPVYAQ